MERIKDWRKRNPTKRREQKQRERDRKFCKTHSLVYEDYILDRTKYKLAMGVRVKRAQRITPEQKQVTKLVKHAAERARKNGVPFDLSVRDLNIPDKCPYLGITLNKVNTKSYCPNNCSLDRIIPENGYVKGNVQVISFLANSMKNEASIDQLIVFAENIIKIHKT